MTKILILGSSEVVGHQIMRLCLSRHEGMCNRPRVRSKNMFLSAGKNFP